MTALRQAVLVTWFAAAVSDWLLVDACFSSPSTQVQCECRQQPQKRGVCTLMGTHAQVPEMTWTDTSYKELVLVAAEEGATVETIDSQSFDGLGGLITLRVEGVKVGALAARAFLPTSGTLYNLHMADNDLDAANVSTEAFQALTQLRTLNISGNRLQPLGGWFEGVTGLQNLYLPRNGLTHLDHALFSRLVALKMLDLSGNALTEVAAETFLGPTYLETLALRSNALTAISKVTFMHIYRLATLDLSHNRISSIPEDAFSLVTTLTTLHMRNNSIATLPVGLFLQNTRLEHVSLDMNDLQTLDADLFKPCGAIQRIMAANNRISSLPSTLFREYSSLQEVDLAHNALAALEGALFSGLSSLQRLYLGGNQLAALSAEHFQVMYGLLTLDLAHNHIVITDLSGAFLPFRNLGKLNYLFLEGNRIGEVPDNLFSGLEELRELNLSSNDLGSIGPRGLESLVSLERLDLSNNSLSGLPADLSRAHLSGLAYLHLSGNQLAPMNESSLTDLGGLQGLYLAGCGLSRLAEGTLQLAQLHTLDISHNTMLQLDGSPFAQLSGLRFLHMRSSGITSLPATALWGSFPSLAEVDLSGNSIGALHQGAFANMTSGPIVNLTYNSLLSLGGGLGGTEGVTTLDLRWNSIRCLEPTMEGDTPHLAYHLSHNPLECDCYLAWARGTLSSCTNALGACVRDEPRCARTGGSALDVPGDPCVPWKCPDPPRQLINTSGGQRPVPGGPHTAVALLAILLYRLLEYIGM